jgi:hypothetical protein
MPGFDQTGPMGHGPGSGRGMGFCGFGWRNMFAGRHGFGRYFGYHRQFTREEKAVALEEYKKALTEELEDVEAALKNPDLG